MTLKNLRRLRIEEQAVTMRSRTFMLGDAKVTCKALKSNCEDKYGAP